MAFFLHTALEDEALGETDQGSYLRRSLSTCWVQVGEDHRGFVAVAGLLAAAGACSFPRRWLFGDWIGAFLHLPDIEQRLDKKRAAIKYIFFILAHFKKQKQNKNGN